jgi:hypothetical protein
VEADSPIVDEVRRRRHELSARFGHDLDKYYAHLLEVQSQYRSRVVSQIRVVAESSKDEAVSPASDLESTPDPLQPLKKAP